eukprot:TRINITY_DN7811_c0_g1_i1.p1 TRINITY_DN7811_c0_g1~~TRINITY_DN7811_c0_g1_i1.p1  ORF type:complete len:125 (+),score=19.76 TRINITY_DN7811_c0_g1_i1:282-656(+)
MDEIQMLQFYDQRPQFLEPIKRGLQNAVLKEQTAYDSLSQAYETLKQQLNSVREATVATETRISGDSRDIVELEQKISDVKKNVKNTRKKRQILTPKPFKLNMRHLELENFLLNKGTNGSFSNN